MSQVHTSFFQLFKKGLGYKQFSYFRRNYNCASFPALLQLCPTHVESVRHISENNDLKRRINSKLHNRVISNEEIEEDRKLSQSMLNLPEEDNFGLLKKEQGTKRGKIKFTNYDKQFGEKKSLFLPINYIFIIFSTQRTKYISPPFFFFSSQYSIIVL
jgi:hypothetical protein